jgi:integrase
VSEPPAGLTFALAGLWWDGKGDWKRAHESAQRALGVGRKWVFQSRTGTPINSGNVRRRFLHPAAAAVGVKIGGWHDFRHTLTRMMRRAGVNAVVVSGTLGHKKVELAAEVYDRASSTDIGQALHVVGKQLLPSVLPNQSAD